MRGSGAAQPRPRRHRYRRFPPLVGSSAENIGVSDPVWIEGVKVQTRFLFFFSRLSAVCLTPAVFCYLQSFVFIPRARHPLVPLASLLIWPPSEGAGRGLDYNKSAY